MKNQQLQISLFYCSNSLSAEEIQYCNSKIEGVRLKAISLPCSGKVNLLYLLKAIETGADGVMLMTCKIGECKYLREIFGRKNELRPLMTYWMKQALEGDALNASTFRKSISLKL